MNPAKEQQVCVKYCANLRKSATETLTMIRQAFRDESIGHTQVPGWER
jgi:hypothetical protein